MDSRRIDCEVAVALVSYAAGDFHHDGLSWGKVSRNECVGKIMELRESDGTILVMPFFQWIGSNRSPKLAKGVNKRLDKIKDLISKSTKVYA